MKRLKVAIVAAALAGSVVTGEAMAGSNGIDGLLLGAGGGALVGQAIGRDTEGTLIGTAVGGMLGYIAGNERDKAYGGNYPPPQPVAYGPPPPPRPIVYDPPPPPVHVVYDPPPPVHVIYDPPPRPVVFVPPPPPRRHHYRPVEVCRETVVVNERHGRYREETTTVCRDRGGWRDRGDWWDDGYRRDRREHHARW